MRLTTLTLSLGLLILLAPAARAQTSAMDHLYKLKDAKTRSISPENFTGAKGKGGMSIDGPAANAARDLGQGWKVSPYVKIKSGATFVLAEISGSGAIQQIWMTPTGNWRYSIFRIYWDGQEQPSWGSAASAWLTYLFA